VNHLETGIDRDLDPGARSGTLSARVIRTWAMVSAMLTGMASAVQFQGMSSSQRDASQRLSFR